MNNEIQIQAQAAAFRRMIEYFQEHPEIQNIDMMTMAGFCRNCLSKWYAKGMEESGGKANAKEAQVFVYGMPYDEWKQKHQTEASSEQLRAYEAAQQKRQQTKNVLGNKQSG